MKLKWIKNSVCLGLFCLSPFLKANDETTTVQFNGLFTENICTVQVNVPLSGATQEKDGGTEAQNFIFDNLVLNSIKGATLKNIYDTAAMAIIFFDFKSCGTLTKATLSFAPTSKSLPNGGTIFPLQLQGGGESVNGKYLGLAVTTTPASNDYFKNGDTEEVNLDTSAAKQATFYVYPVIYATPPADGLITESLIGTIQINIAYE